MSNPNTNQVASVVHSPTPSFAQHIVNQSVQIEKWFRHNWQQTPAPFYASCDLRNAGFKVAPVDTNLFPAGFNNLARDAAQMATFALQSRIDDYCPEAVKILIIAENHTRNLRYLQSLKCLQNFLAQAGFETRLSNLSKELQSRSKLVLENGDELVFDPLKRHHNKLVIGDFVPCVVLLNNDLSAGVPAILKGLDQHLLPALDYGWQSRTKSHHFDEYAKVAAEFALAFGLDSWQLTPNHSVVKNVDFSNGQGIDELIHQVDQTLHQTQQIYQQRAIEGSAYAVVKANAGTYGMGVMALSNSDSLRQLNRKTRNKMKVGKEGLKINQLLVQEGVPSYETMAENQAVAEPVVYMINHYVIGGFYRIHQGRGRNENLNAPGMYFQPLSFEHCLDSGQDYNVFNRSLFYVYGVVARLALLAAAREIADH